MLRGARWFERFAGWFERFLFGDDVFLSYSRDDGGGCVTAYENALSKAGLSCFVDQHQPTPGREIPEEVYRGLRRSAVLVVLATRGAFRSRGVAEEIVEFLKTKRPIQLIDLVGIDSRTDFPDWFEHMVGAPLIAELGGAGSPAPRADTVERVAATVGRWRRSRRLRYASIASPLLLILSIGIGGAGSVFFARKVSGALAELKDARGAQAQAVASTRALEARIPQLHASAASLAAAVESANATLARANGEIARKDVSLHAETLAAAGRDELGRDAELAVVLARSAVEAAPSREAIRVLRQTLERFVPNQPYGGDSVACVLAGGQFALRAPLSGPPNVWDLRRRRVVWTGTATYQGQWFRCAAGLPHAAIVRTDGSAVLLDLSGQAPKTTAVEPNGPDDKQITHVEITPDGSRFSIVRGDVAKIWDSGGRLVRELPMPVLDDLLLLSSTQVVTLSLDGVLRSVNLAKDGEEAMTEIAAVPKRRGNALRSIAGGQFFVLSAEANQLWRVAPLGRIGEPAPWRSFLARDARSVASVEGTLVEVSGFNPVDGKFDSPLRTVYGAQPYRFECHCPDAAVELFPERYRYDALAVVNETIKIMDPKTGVRMAELRGDVLAENWAISDDGKRVFGTRGAWTVFPDGPPRSQELPADEGYVVHAAEFSPDARAIALLADNGRVYWFKHTEKSWKLLWSGAAPMKRCAFTVPFALEPAGREVVVVGDNGIARSINAEGKDQDRGKVTECAALALNPHGQRLISTRPGARMAGDKNLVEVDCAVTRAAVSPDDSVIAVGCAGETVLVDLSTGRRLKSFAGSVFAFDSSGARILVGHSERGQVALWQRRSRDWSDSSQLYEFSSNHPDLSQISWRADGQFAVTTGRDGAVRAWDIATGDLVWSRSSGSANTLRGAAFLDSSRTIVSLWSNIVRADACEVCRSAEDLVAFARSRTSRQLTQAEREKYAIAK